ncbi:hypothetical protein [Deinococcus sp.]|uniref:hypothetical protein n=1 Tax=Deinococcus sp. TaxID=47478 RepID=UPI003B5BB566
MKTVGPYVAARSLEGSPPHGPARPVTTLRALDRLTGLPTLVYLLPRAVPMPELPPSPSLLPYSDFGMQQAQAYLASELPPHATPAADALQTALGGLRALNALHEAGLIHGGVGPHQLWAWDNEVRLSGAALPWGEAQGALAAPEGGSSPAADLYALGVTLLRLGPLPPGLGDLLSPFPAQRPSARDALARLNAGPPLPPERTPLLTQAPLRPRPAAVPEDAPLPLIADPDARIAPLATPVQDVHQADQALSAQAMAEATPDAPQSNTQQVVEVAPEPDPPPDESVDWSDVFPSSLVQQLNTLGERASKAKGGDEPPSLEDAALLGVNEENADSQEASSPAETSAVQADEGSPVESVSASTDVVPALEEPSFVASAEGTADVILGDVTAEAVPLSAAPTPEPDAAQQTEPKPPISLSKGETKVAQTEDAPPDGEEKQVASAEAAPPTAPVSPRILKPVRIGWSEDGSWRVNKSDPDQTNPNAPGADANQAGGPPPFVRQPAARSTAVRPNWLWIAGLLLVVVLLLLIRLAFQPSAARSAPAASLCCTVSARVLGSAGQPLSAPLRFVLVTPPPASRLTAGTLVGQMPGPLTLDAPGRYDLNVTGEGYASQTASVTVPTREPLVIRLE